MTDYVAAVCNLLDCQFFGSNYELATAIFKNRMLLNQWMSQEGTPALPVVLLERSGSNLEAQKKLGETQQSYKDVGFWLFKKFDRHGNVSNDIILLDNPMLNLGGYLYGLPRSNESTMIEVGVEIRDDATHEILASTSTMLLVGKEYGITIPHQRPRHDQSFKLLVKKVIDILCNGKFSGFATITFIAWLETPKSIECSIKLLDIAPNLSNSIVLALSLQSKNGLCLNQSNFELDANESTPWAFTFLTKTNYLDKDRLKTDFEAATLHFKPKVFFSMDLLHHDIFKLISKSIVSVSIRAAMQPFDSWTAKGVDFPLTPSNFHIMYRCD